MKKQHIILSFLLAAFIATSCTKQSSELRTVQTAGAVAPALTTYKWYKVYEAGETHVAFDLTLSIQDTAAVSKVNLYRYPSLLRGSVNHPASGVYTIYDHISTYPTFAASAYWQFEFEMKNGTKIELDKFQVY